MAKEKSSYICGECGYETPRWMGKCPQCGSWNTLVEEQKLSIKSSHSIQSRAIPLKEVEAKELGRRSTGIEELDRVLGGGIVQGMTVLLGGSPGIGKSTLLLQTAHNLSKSGRVLYVSGEESKSQIRLRADRLGLMGDMLLLCETSVEQAVEEARDKRVDYLIVDSIQTMLSDETASAPGSVTQIRTCAAQLVRFAKEYNCPLFLVGHVTKEGALAGPKVLEHMVDTVLHFQGDRQEDLRLLRAEKNRFGSTNELGVFEMTQKGMEQVSDPSRLFLSGNPPAAGCAVTCVMEGTRPLLTEVQSLLCSSVYPSPRRTALGMDVSRLNLILAVLEKRAGLRVSDKDAYLSGAGSLPLQDRGADLGAALCLASAYYDKPMPQKTVAIGELGLTGEIRSVSHMEQRIKECRRLGYTRILVPHSTRISSEEGLVRVRNIFEAVSSIAYSKKGEQCAD